MNIWARQHLKICEKMCFFSLVFACSDPLRATCNSLVTDGEINSSKVCGCFDRASEGVKHDLKTTSGVHASRHTSTEDGDG